ncbi:MAG: type II secretion system protein [Oleiphilaceae bacterium]|nr:type II secretion system protein [Oleiphilaceae bacterium]
MQRKQQGFTLIELVIVIVILGVLSAFALPRFADLGGDARASTIQGATGSIRAASAIARSACLASADCDESAASDQVTLEGDTVDLAFGFPNESATGIVLAAQLGDDFEVNTGVSPITIRTASRPDDATCQVSYGEPGADGERPAITVDVSGC